MCFVCRYGDVLASPECNTPTGRTEPKVVSAPDRELVPGLPADQIQRAPEPNSRMLLHSSSVVFGEAGGPSQRLTFDPSWVTAYTEAAEGQRLSGQNFNPVERLPTFTSRRPDDLPRYECTTCSRIKHTQQTPCLNQYSYHWRRKRYLHSDG